MQEARRRGRREAFAAVHAAVDRAGERERLLGAGHADVAEAALLFDLLGIIERTGMREDAFLEAGEEDVIEFEALGGVQREQREWGALVEVVGVADEGGAVEEIGKRFATLGAVGDSVHEFADVVGAGDIFRRRAG